LRNKHLVHFVFELSPFLFHLFDREIVDRDVFFFKVLNLMGKLVIFIEQLQEIAIRLSQQMHRIDILWELMVKLVMLNLHNRDPSLILANQRTASVVEKQTCRTA
jgi:hypothetical protein